MKITFYAHASFRLDADGVAVVTDPYTPGPGHSGFDPIDEPADVVLMSSATDRISGARRSWSTPWTCRPRALW